MTSSLLMVDFCCDIVLRRRDLAILSSICSTNVPPEIPEWTRKNLHRHWTASSLEVSMSSLVLFSTFFLTDFGWTDERQTLRCWQVVIMIMDLYACLWDSLTSTDPLPIGWIESKADNLFHLQTAKLLVIRSMKPSLFKSFCSFWAVFRYVIFIEVLFWNLSLKPTLSFLCTFMFCYLKNSG